MDTIKQHYYKILKDIFIDISLFAPKSKILHFTTIDEIYAMLDEQFSMSISDINIQLLNFIKKNYENDYNMIHKGIGLYREHFKIKEG